jgi:regulator of sigma E protease
MEMIGNALLALNPMPMTVRDRNGQTRHISLPLNQLPAGQPIDQYFDKLGLHLAPPPAIAGSVKPGQPAAVAGLQGGDRIVSVDGQPVADFIDLGKLVQSHAANSPKLAIAIQRNGQSQALDVTARWESMQGQPAKWMLGIAPPEAEPATVQYGPVKALGAALTATWRNTRQTFSMIGDMLSGRASTKNISSVIGIAQYANASAQMGLAWFLQFLAMVSLSLAILNLLPIPVLDGGHLLYYLIELVKGSPVSEQVMVIGQYIGLVLLFSLVGWTLFNDIQRTLLS